MTDKVELGTSQALDVVRRLNKQFKLFEQLEEVLEAALRSDKELNRTNQSRQTATKQLADAKRELSEAQDALSTYKEQAKAEVDAVAKGRAEAIQKHNQSAKEQMQEVTKKLLAEQMKLTKASNAHKTFMAEANEEKDRMAGRFSKLRTDLDKLKSSLVGA